MKQAFILLLVFSNFLCFSQKDSVVTKLDKEIFKTGALIRTEIIGIGDFGGLGTNKVKVATVKTTDLANDITVKGIYVTVDNIRNTVDEDEVDGLIISLERMRSLLNTKPPKTYNEFKFSTISGFELVVETYKDDWVFYIKTKHFIDTRSHMHLRKPMESLKSFYDLILKAKEELR